MLHKCVNTATPPYRVFNARMLILLYLRASTGQSDLSQKTLVTMEEYLCIGDLFIFFCVGAG